MKLRGAFCRKTKFQGYWKLWLFLGTLLQPLRLCSQTSISRTNGDWLLQIEKQTVVFTFSTTGGRGCGGDLFATKKFNNPFKTFKTRLSPPVTPVVQATSLWARLGFFRLHPSSVPSPLPGNYYKVSYTPFTTWKMYPLLIPTQLILGMKISISFTLILFIQNHTTYFVTPSYTPACENLVTLSFEAWVCTPFGYILIYAIMGSTPWAYSWSPLLPLKTGSQINIEIFNSPHSNTLSVAPLSLNKRFSKVIRKIQHSFGI